LRKKSLWLWISLGVGCWLLMALIDAFLLNKGSLVSQLIWPEFHQSLVRLLLAAYIALRQSRRKDAPFQSLSASGRDIIYRCQVLPAVNIEYISPAIKSITGYDPEEFYADPKLGLELIHPDDLPLLRSSWSSPDPIALRLRCKDGSLVWVEQASIPIYRGDDLVVLEGIARDITRHKQMEAAIADSRDFYSRLLDGFPLLIWRSNSKDQCDYFNRSWLEFTGRTWEEEQGLGWLKGVHPDDRESYIEIRRQASARERPFEAEYRLQGGDGHYHWISELGSPFRDRQGEFAGYIGACRDVTSHKLKEEEMVYLSFHDKLTGLYSRAFFEQELHRLDTLRQLPITIIMADINGLKLLNDSRGHQAGDRLLCRLANLLQRSCRQEDIIARWGGDEFAILLPQTGEEAAITICARIKAACGALPLNVSLGTATKMNPADSIYDILAEAESRMCRNKLLRERSAHGALISSLGKALEERDLETEAHNLRLRKLALQVGYALELPDSQIDELILLASLHDIGKIAIPDEILFKPGKLTEAEWEIMRRHPEVGYRIALASPQLAHIAPAILAHHERWDGLGYPKGLRGEEIPLLARIIAVIDAYDAMTSGRPYKKAISPEEAKTELRRCAGTQFDPRVVEALMELSSWMTPH
jgi:diguanylate cyclase (GGDEF)-like protein/PAS domain S-box-containing protein